MKVGLFALVGILSNYLKVFFIKLRKVDATKTVSIHNKLIWRLRLELILIIPFSATLMAKGIGL